MNTASSPRFGIIGAGTIGRIHLNALRDAKLEVVAIADPVPAALERAKEFAPNAKLYQDWKAILQDPSVDAVNICTINSLHFGILREAVASGKHVFCEKTLTINANQAREALGLKITPGQIVQAGYMKRFFPASIQAKQWMKEIGHPICASVRSFQGGWPDARIYDDPGWRPGPEGVSHIRGFASGGMLNMAGSHMLDMTAWLLGQPETIFCKTWAPDDYDAELHSHALFKMRGGALVHFEAALSDFCKTGAYSNGWDESVQITGTEGRLEIYYPVWDRPTEFPARVRLYKESLKEWQETELPIVNPFQREMEAFARACRGENGEFPGIRDALLVDFWIDACYESAASGKPVSLPQV